MKRDKIHPTTKAERMEIFAELMQVLGWNHARLAMEFMVSQVTVWRWLNGKSRPPLAKILRARQLLDAARKAETSGHQRPMVAS